MIFLDFFIFITASLGLIHIIVHAPVAEWFRDAIVKGFDLIGKREVGEYFIHCPPCVGVWVGILMTTLFLNGLILYTMPLSVSFFALIAQLYWYPES